MDTFCSWLENHVAICTWVVASCSLLTFVLSFIFKKKKKDSTHSQNISNVQGTTIVSILLPLHPESRKSKLVNGC